MLSFTATKASGIDAETYQVRADEDLLICEPADLLPLAQKYYLYLYCRSNRIVNLSPSSISSGLVPL